MSVPIFRNSVQVFFKLGPLASGRLIDHNIDIHIVRHCEGFEFGCLVLLPFFCSKERVFASWNWGVEGIDVANLL